MFAFFNVLPLCSSSFTFSKITTLVKIARIEMINKPIIVPNPNSTDNPLYKRIVVTNVPAEDNNATILPTL